MTTRSYCFTINNYTDDELKCVRGLVDNFGGDFRYVCFGIEKGDSGTPHLQGYLELKSAQKSGFLKKHGFSRAHLEKRKATREEARAYCTKEGKFEEFGTFATGGRGSRNDIRALRDAIYAGASWVDVIDQFPDTVGRFMKFTQKCFEIFEKRVSKEYRQVDVVVLLGDAGTGKTRFVTEAFPDVFTVNTRDSFPFDGYSGEKAILIDDFYGGLPYTVFLDTLEGHRQRLNIKGGHAYARWNHVFITSNMPPDSWYKKGLTPALKRRLGEVVEFNQIAAAPEPVVSSDEDIEHAVEWLDEVRSDTPTVIADSTTGHNVVGNTTEVAEAIPLPPRTAVPARPARQRAMLKLLERLTNASGCVKMTRLSREDDFAMVVPPAPREFCSADRPFSRDDFATYH